MAFSVTARHSANTGTSASTSVTTDSQTPTASSLLLVGVGSQRALNDSTDPTIGTPTGGSLTYTLIATAMNNWQWSDTGSYEIAGKAWRADVGGSPSAFTISSSGGTQNWHVLCADVTGHNTGDPVKASATNGGSAGSGGTGSDTASGSVTLAAAPSSGDLLVVWFGSASDGGGGLAAPTAGSGKSMTSLIAQDAGWTQGRLDYRVCDGTESATITCSDLGQATGNWWSIAVVVNPAAAAGGQPTHKRMAGVPFAAVNRGVW